MSPARFRCATLLDGSVQNFDLLFYYILAIYNVSWLNVDY